MGRSFCVHRKDEFGNYHSRIELGDDLVALVSIKRRLERVDWYITSDGRALNYQSIGAETFCHELPAGEVEDSVLKILERADWVDLMPGAIVISTPEGDEVEIDIFKPEAFCNIMQRLHSRMPRIVLKL
jgi:hypothetical protein